MEERTLSDALQALPTLQAELTRFRHEIAVAEAEDALYTGGLVKSLIAVRLQITRTTCALIEQRIHALESGAPLTIVVELTKPDPDRAAQLEREIQVHSDLLQQARAEASLHAGGLVQSLKLGTVATCEHTLATLRQQHLVAKYGFAVPAAPGPPEHTKNEVAQFAPHAPLAPLPTLFEIVKVDARITESNQSWSRFAWQLTMQSLATTPLRLEATIQFQDAEGFIINNCVEHGLVLGAGLRDTFAGYSLIDASIVGNVRGVAAKVRVA